MIDFFKSVQKNKYLQITLNNLNQNYIKCNIKALTNSFESFVVIQQD